MIRLIRAVEPLAPEIIKLLVCSKLIANFIFLVLVITSQRNGNFKGLLLFR